MNALEIGAWLEQYESAWVVWTIRLAMLMMLASLLLRGGWKHKSTTRPEEFDKHDEDGKCRPATKRPAKPLRFEAAQHTWLLGSLFALLHTLVTLLLVFDGDHSLAYQHTADTTTAYLGVSVGFGIYANHCFVVLWMIDAMTWLAFPVAYQRRSIWWDRAILGFLIFIAFNGTVVFAPGMIRWVSIACFALLGIYWRIHR